MPAIQDRTHGDEPWRIPPPNKYSTGAPDDAVQDGGFLYWIEGEAPDLRIMCAGGPGGVIEIQKENAEYPDEIYRREQELLRAYRERST